MKNLRGGGKENSRSFWATRATCVLRACQCEFLLDNYAKDAVLQVRSGRGAMAEGSSLHYGKTTPREILRSRTGRVIFSFRLPLRMTDGRFAVSRESRRKGRAQRRYKKADPAAPSEEWAALRLLSGQAGITGRLIYSGRRQGRGKT